MKNLLVTGAGGHLGRRVVERLIETEAGHVIATSRDPDKIADLTERGVEVRRADFDDPATLANAFRGADRLLLISTDALHVPGLRLRQHRNAIAAAAAARVAHVVYTSAIDPRPAPTDSLLSDHYWTEQALAASELEWTVLRNNIYTEMLLLAMPHAVQTGQLFSACGEGGRSYVTREDCARTAAAVLAAKAGRQILDVTGPTAVTQAESAAIVSELTGRPVTHVALSPEQQREGLLGAGLPEFMADALVTFDVAAAEGRHAGVAPTVETLTGRKPTSVREFLTAHREALTGG